MAALATSTPSYRRAVERRVALAAAGGPSPDSFAGLLRRYRLRAGLSLNVLGPRAGVNASYVTRLESGERGDPTRPVALGLARALDLSAAETDGFLAAAGHLPPSLQKLAPDDSTVAAVLAVLTNDAIDPASRADLRAVIETLCFRWQGMEQSKAERRAS